MNAQHPQSFRPSVLFPPRKAILKRLSIGIAVFAILATNLVAAPEAAAQRFDRRAGGAMPSGVGGAARPNLGGGARPSPGGTMPNLGGARPNLGGVQPNLGGNRPSLGGIGTPGGIQPGQPATRPTQPATRPNPPTSRPNPGGFPSLGGTTLPQVPSTPLPDRTRPAIGVQRPPTSIPRPVNPELGSRPSLQVPGSVRPTTRPSFPPPDSSRPSPTTRPSFPNRPQRPETLPARPPVTTLPGRPPTSIPRPVVPDRPTIGTRPSIPNRPIIGGGNAIVGGGNTVIGGGNTIIGGGNTNININQNINNWYGNPGWGWNNRPGWNAGWNHSNWYHGHWNVHWGNLGIRPIPSYYFVTWGLGSWATYSSFVNPYFVPSTTTVYNYSQPIIIHNTSQVSPSPTSPAPPDENELGWKQFEAGMAAFGDGKFSVALNHFDNAIRRLPGDPVAHEMRALTYFALGRYTESAAVLNSLLATSPGMDWTTLSGLYGDMELYTTQLRKLEAFVDANPEDAAAMFVLAYHYLVTGHQQDATELLAEVVRLKPQDTTAAQLLKSLTANGDQPPPPPTRSAQVEDTTGEATSSKTDLVGRWLAENASVSILLEVTKDSQFTWTATPAESADKDDEVVTLQGEMLASGETLVLSTESQGTMAGRVQSQGPNQFRFLVPGGPPDDPGLTFSRQND